MLPHIIPLNLTLYCFRHVQRCVCVCGFYDNHARATFQMDFFSVWEKPQYRISNTIIITNKSICYWTMQFASIKWNCMWRWIKLQIPIGSLKFRKTFKIETLSKSMGNLLSATRYGSILYKCWMSLWLHMWNELKFKTVSFSSVPLNVNPLTKGSCQCFFQCIFHSIQNQSLFILNETTFNRHLNWKCNTTMHKMHKLKTFLG